MTEQNNIKVQIRKREDQGAGIAVLELVPEKNTSLPAFDAGAHIDVHIDSEIVRQYSLCNDPSSCEHYRIGVLNDPNSRGGSKRLFDSFSAGQRIIISAPRNHFPLDKSAQKTILAGGGIGITPMMAMAYTLRAEGKKFELHYCTRTQGAGAFEQELIDEFGGDVVFHYDDQAQEQKFDPKALLNTNHDGVHLYVCGPTGFMDWVMDSAKSVGFPPEQIHYEYFNADVEMSGESFEVYCEESDVTVQVEDGQSIAQCLKAAGVKVSVSCESGVCGTCITDVLEGTPDHRDQFLTEEEKEDNDQIALCCSRAKSSRIVLDL